MITISYGWLHCDICENKLVSVKVKVALDETGRIFVREIPFGWEEDENGYHTCPNCNGYESYEVPHLSSD